MVNEELLFGIYRLSKIEATKNNIPTTEKENDGMFVFTRDHKLSVVSGSNEWVMAYTGDFEIKGDILLIHVKSCVFRELESTTIQRKILLLDEKNLILDASGADSKKRTIVSWYKASSL